MKYILLVIILVFTAKAEYNSYSDFVEDFKKFKLSDISFEVKDVLICKDAGKVFLKEGRVYYFNEIDHLSTGFVFIGDGIFMYNPSSKTELYEIQRKFNKNMIMEEFDTAFMMFDSEDWQEYFKGFEAKGRGYEKRYAEKYVEDIMKQTLFKDSLVKLSVTDTYLNKRNNSMNYFQFKLKNEENLAFEIDPFSSEPVKLYDIEWYSIVGYQKFLMSTNKLIENRKRPLKKLDVKHRKISAFIDKNKKFKFDVQIDVCVNETNIGWHMFLLYGSLEIDSIYDNRKNKINFEQIKGKSLIWVEIPNNYLKGDTIQMYFKYDGKLISEYGDLNELNGTYYWFPTFTYNDDATFDATYEYVKDDNYLISVGNLMSSTTTDSNTVIERYVENTSTERFTFQFGEYLTKKYQNNDLSFTLLYNTEEGKEDRIYDDIKESLQYFTKIFGKLDTNTVSLIEMPTLVSSANKGLVFLSTTDFWDFGYWGAKENEMGTCVHEIAHQWWGNGVDVESYHDLWMFEGLAEYSSLLYVLNVKKDAKEFYGALNGYKNSILKIGEDGLFKNGTKPGSVYLGRKRNSNVILYGKSLWIFHMLKNMLLDLNNPDDTMFFEALRKFYKNYKGKKVTTYDLIKHFEYTFTVDMQWFFDQWVFDYKIPKYSYSLKSEEVTKNGKNVFSTKLYVRQDNVPDDFKASIPVTIKFDDEKYVRFRFFMTGKEIAVNLADYPMEPEEIIFNDFNSVLCDTDEIDWEDEFDTLIK